jgi:hypothetical protein
VGLYFRPTPTNVTALLVIALAIFAVAMLMRKRYDSNLPLLFYFVAFIFATFFDRPVDPRLMYSGLALVLLLRFEFLGVGMTKFIAFCANAALVLMIWAMALDLGA